MTQHDKGDGMTKDTNSISFCDGLREAIPKNMVSDFGKRIGRSKSFLFNILSKHRKGHEYWLTEADYAAILDALPMLRRMVSVGTVRPYPYVGKNPKRVASGKRLAAHPKAVAARKKPKAARKGSDTIDLGALPEADREALRQLYQSVLPQK